jgi:tetratricopeptide (TPR) repeat protein
MKMNYTALINIFCLFGLIAFLSVNGLSQSSSIKDNAIEQYRNKLEQYGSTVELHFNLGNSYLKEDSIAAAIYNYELALLIDPTSADVINNLKIARSRLEEQLVDIPDFFLFTYWDVIRNQLKPNSWAILSVLMMLVFCVLWFWVLYKGLNWPRRYIILLFVILGFIVVITLALSIDGNRKFTITKGAIIFQKEFMKSGPDSRSENLKQLYPGYKLQILDEIEGWMKVRTIDREEGWVLPQWVKVIEIK